MALSRREFIDHIIDVYGSISEASKNYRLIYNDTGWDYRKVSNSFYVSNGISDPVYPIDIPFKDKCKTNLDGFSYWDNAWWRTC